ncbi:MAG: two-component system, NtrC family, nitrogen regulation response regulator NtrX [Anaerophaga sp.]|uniref:sigma-54-dependent transcriptional regulator n=1 Tax=Anaerophaga thermohalophila TaxID=177400 RepID=UPI000237BC7A|nr:sigma-54 dependent transcriptional regulator [Anaerophaga thermohalophila]MDI3521425.1 two-component system, NtrC family, nitrogen regulation response regulator NtrX [Anaerophaga sp.]MDK2841650.1 two-component system, NtrC family, nitrogen regulation response regulator NtrX [Anaerophaga sp.]MDN5291975.1 two-component system, NtrC family, nitrogen regulation response regulator NtrX [Anaerophaga sp.]
MSKILVIDDQKSIRNTLRDILEYEKHEVVLAENGPEGLEHFEADKFDAVLLDIKMPDMDGMEVLDKMMQSSPDTPVIMISGHGNIDTAVEAIKKGAYDFIEKPLDLNRLLVTIRNGIDKKELVNETKVLRRKVSKTYEMIGESEPMKRVKEMIDKVAPTDARVLITGQNGTGKELVARWLHEKSNRAGQPFIEVNCAAIPSELIESELFGHEKGAFTSAYKQRKGKFEQANGGTIFLDEIGDMSHAAQAKVLRALQENVISRVGSDKDIKVDVRILAATNKNLQEEIREGRFREDLYHRLSVIIIHVPSLNERKDDIPLLTDYFNNLICQELGVQPKTFDESAVETLKSIKWTGNIREFRNVIERLIILGSDTITEEDVKTYAMPLA